MFVGGGQRSAIDLEEVVALGDLNAGSAERSAQLRIPVLARVDVLNAIVSVLHREIRAQHADRHGRVGGLVAGAGEIGVSDRQLAARERDEVAEVVAMADVREQR